MERKALTLCLSLWCVALSSAESGMGLEQPTGGVAGCSAASKLLHQLALGSDDGTNELFYDRPRYTGPSACRLPQTCCSREAEQDLSLSAVEDAKQRVAELWEKQTSSCTVSTFKDALTQFIDDSKASLLELLDIAFFGFFTRYTLFDEFYDYLKEAITTGNSCQISYKFNKLFFEVFLAVLEADPNIDTTVYPENNHDFNVCVYRHYQEIIGEQTHSRFVALTRSFNRTLYYIRALNTAERFLQTVNQLDFTPQCRQALLRSSYCAECGGVSRLETRTCREFCLNTLRGCLVDYSDLQEPFERFTQAAIRMKNYLDTNVNPFNHIGQLTTGFFDTVATLHPIGQSIHQEILIECVGNRGRREAEPGADEERLYPRSLVTRSTVPPPAGVFNESAYCLLDVAPLFRTVPGSVCEDLTGPPLDEGCWNGETVGGYSREVIDFNRYAQQDNPELIVCGALPRPVVAQLGYLERATLEMNIVTRSQACPEDDEDCVVDENRCDFTDLSPVQVSVVSISTDDEDSRANSGSGCGSSGYGSGFGSGSGDCRTVVEECLVDDLVPTTTAVPTVPTSTVLVVTPSTTATTSTTSAAPATSALPSATPPTKEPPIVIVTQAGSSTVLPSAAVLLLLSLLTVLQSVL